MGYSKSKVAVERVQAILEILLKSDTQLRVPTKTPDRLAYAVREGIVVAALFKQYERFTVLKNKYKIKVKSDAVIFVPRIDLALDLPVEELARSMLVMEIPDVKTALEIVGACIQHKAPEFIFPAAHLNDLELQILKRWTNMNNYEVIQTEPHLILRKTDAHNDKKDSNATE